MAFFVHVTYRPIGQLTIVNDTAQNFGAIAVANQTITIISTDSKMLDLIRMVKIHTDM